MISIEEIAPRIFIARCNGCSGGGSSEYEAKEQLYHAMINDRIMNPEKYKAKETLIYDRTNNRHYTIIG